MENLVETMPVELAELEPEPAPAGPAPARTPMKSAKRAAKKAKESATKRRPAAKEKGAAKAKQTAPKKRAAKKKATKKARFASSDAGDAGATTEIEQALCEVLADLVRVEKVSADSHFFQDLGADSMVMAHFCARVRKRPDLPSISMKDIYRHPTIRSLAAAVAEVAPAGDSGTAVEFGGLERALAEVLAEVLKVERVQPDAHFFKDLGADSMVMAHFCARVRKRADLPSISMKQVYANPTIRGLASAVADAAPASAVVTASASTQPSPAPLDLPEPIATWRYVLCGVLQFLTSFAYLALSSWAFIRGYAWMLAGSSYLDTYLRSLFVTAGLLSAAIALPILAKWVIVGRWKPQEIRIWSLAYYRFWLVKTLVRANPLALFVGTPIYVFYLRALGAKIGKNVLILSTHVPVCTDLLTIGDNAVIRKDSYFSCYRAHAGRIQIGPVRLGKDTVVGEMTVLDIDTSMGDGAQIGHSSSLHAGQSIPAGEHRHGSPAREKTDVDYAAVAPAQCGRMRRVSYSLSMLLPMVLFLPATIVVAARSLVWFSGREYFDAPGTATYVHHAFYRDLLIGSTALFFGALILGLLLVVTVPRLLNRLIEPDKVYPLYGFHYWVQVTIARLTNVEFFTLLFGDSSYIVYYLQAIGYRFSKIVQTGSNFGTEVRHDNPFLVTIGSGTMAADGLSIVNMVYSSSSFRVSRVKIGGDSFFGNHVLYPSHGKTGDNCLFATKVMIPLDGEVREGVGLLGSPSFEVPRTVLRDSQIAEDFHGEELRRRISRKNRHNIATMGLLLLSNWGHTTGLLMLSFAAIDIFPTLGSLAMAAALMAIPFFSLLYHALVERACTRFRPLTPHTCSIYDPYFWFHERFWKLMAEPQLTPFDGTPLKGLVWRLFGLRVGRRLFDDGAIIIERTMVTIGDDCTLNLRSIVQPHSQEDGGFKSDRIAIGSDCTIGINALVHYGTTMGDGSQLAPSAFLMKGEEVPPYTRWEENPAREVGRFSVVKAANAVPALSQPSAIALPAFLRGAQAR